MKTFMVTGHGRSGTCFLARALNMSPTWVVHHENIVANRDLSLPSNGARDQLSPDIVRDRFSKEAHKAKLSGRNYGTVNGYLRYHGWAAQADKKAVILRHPYHIALSVHNRGNYGHFKRCAKYCFRSLDKMMERSDFFVIRFTDMFSSVQRFTEIAKSLGVTDVPITEDILRKKVNQGKGSDKRLPKKEAEWVDRELGWYTKKWFS